MPYTNTTTYPSAITTASCFPTGSTITIDGKCYVSDAGYWIDQSTGATAEQVNLQTSSNYYGTQTHYYGTSSNQPTICSQHGNANISQTNMSQPAHYPTDDVFTEQQNDSYKQKELPLDEPKSLIKGIVVQYINIEKKYSFAEQKKYFNQLISDNMDLVHTYAEEGFATIWLADHSNIASHLEIYQVEKVKYKRLIISTGINPTVSNDIILNHFCKSYEQLVACLYKRGIGVLTISLDDHKDTPIKVYLE